jgi:putative effector of murein hydrolase
MHSLLPPIHLFHVWAYLQTQPLLGLTMTLCVWELACFLDSKAGHKAFSNPIMLSIFILAAVLLLTHTSYATYFTGAQYIHFLLGPATVALAVPMYANWPAIKRDFVAILISLTAGSIAAAASAMWIARALGASHAVVISLGPKSVTTPIAMGIADGLGTVLCVAVFKLARITDWRAQGLAAGTAAHGMATARMLLLSQTAGAFGGLAIGLNGIITSLTLPLLVKLFGF